MKISVRLFATLWSVTLSPLLSIQLRADERSAAELVPAESLGWIAWEKPAPEKGLQPASLNRLIMAAAQTEGPADAELLSAITTVVERLLTDATSIIWVDLAPEPGLAMVVESGTDTESLICAFETLLRSSGAVQKLEISGLPFRAVGEDGRGRICWGACKKYFLLTVSQLAAQRVIERIQGGGASHNENTELLLGREKCAEAQGRWTAGGFLDTTRLLARVKELTGAHDPVVGATIDALGLDGLKSGYLKVVENKNGSESRLFMHMSGPRKGLLSLWDQAPLTEEDLQQISRDASWAWAFNLNLSRLWNELRAGVASVNEDAVQQIDAGVAMAAKALGFSITDELLPALGDTWVLYDDPAHGGWLFTGAVLVLEVKDAEAVKGVLARCVELLAPPLAGENIHLRLKQTTQDGFTIHYVMVGGAPSPFAPAWSVVGDRLVIGLYPQTVRVALNQANPRKRPNSLLKRDDVKQGLKHAPMSGTQAVGFIDMKEFTRAVYPFGLILGTMGYSVAAIDPEIELAGALPTLAEALREAKPTVSACVSDDDGVRYMSVGSVGPLALLAAAALTTSVALPSLSRARYKAKEAVTLANLRAIGMACHVHAANHDGAFPPSLQALIDEGLISPAQLFSLLDPQYAGDSAPPAGYSSFEYIPGQRSDGDPMSILAFERDGRAEGVAVLFLDNHCALLSQEELREALQKTRAGLSTSAADSQR